MNEDIKNNEKTIEENLKLPKDMSKQQKANILVERYNRNRELLKHTENEIHTLRDEIIRCNNTISKLERQQDFILMENREIQKKHFYLTKV